MMTGNAIDGPNNNIFSLRRPLVMMENEPHKNKPNQSDSPSIPKPANRTFASVEKDVYTRLLNGAGEPELDFKVTRTTMFDQTLCLLQPQQGYRFSLDAVLLADFADIGPGQAVADLGAGVGIIGIILARRIGYGRVVLVELQPRLAALARRNITNNALGPDMDVLEMDWNDLTADLVHQPMVGGQVDYVVCNPPYRSLGTGRVNPNNEEAIARHEIRGSLVGMIKAAKQLLVPGGKLAVIYPASRMARLMAELKNRGFEPKRMRMVHSRTHEGARFVMVEAKMNAGEELDVLPPLIIYRNAGDYSREIKTILSGRLVAGPSGGPAGP